MSYTSYDTSIVKKYSVRIFGWPANIPMVSPFEIIPIKDLRTLRESWRSGATCWNELTQREVNDYLQDMAERRARGEIIGKPRKLRADNGKKRPHYGAGKENDENDDAAEPARKKTKSGTAANPKSKATSKKNTAKSKSKPKSKPKSAPKVPAVVEEESSSDSGDSISGGEEVSITPSDVALRC